MGMGAAVKAVGGLILILIGLGLFADSLWNLLPGPQINWISNFIITLTGVIPILLIILGLFIVWLEMDEMKARKQLVREAAKAPAVQPSEPAKSKPAKKADAEPNVDLNV